MHETAPTPVLSEQKPRRAALAWLALGLVVGTVLALLVLDLMVVRPPAQREFIARNIECLRCHADLIPRLKQASVHQPFLTQHCTSCHTPHGYEKRGLPAVTRRSWLQVQLERLGLTILWEALQALRPQTEQSAQQATTILETGGPSALTTGQEELCWTCHGNLSADRLMTFQHPPFAKGQCASCHDPHASDHKTLMRAETRDVCVSCHRIAPELLAADVHLPFGQRQCTTCHEPHSSSHGGLLVAAQRDLCFGCHTDTASQLGEAVLHDPFVNGRCTGCHRPHSASFSALLGSPQPELCYGCHGEVRGQFAAASRHPFPSRLLCSDCHRPHAAPVGGLLPVAQRRLCLGCHGEVGAQLTQAQVHASVARGDCTQCHVPHGSQAGPLLQASDPTLCLRCHPGIPARRVRGGAPGKRAEPKAPANAQVKLGTLGVGVRPSGLPDPVLAPGPRSGASGAAAHRVRRCGECHRAHASDYSRLLVVSGDSLCLRCHSATAPRFRASAHGRLACSSCHAPHHPKGPNLLTRSGTIALCTSCHGGFMNGGSDHPVGAQYYDYLANGPLTCASTCHDPHGSRYYRMLRVPYDSDGKGSDYICLLCHTKVGVVY